MFPEQGYDLPGGGRRNNNQPIGDFCCTGETATFFDGSKRPIGYVYVFGWPGQAVSTPGRTLVPGLTILVSGSRRPGDVTAVRDTSSVVFRAGVLQSKTQVVKVGALRYKVTLNSAVPQQFNGQSYFDLASARVHVTAAIGP